MSAVRLDPFQNIVNVHWAPPYAAFRFDLFSQNEDSPSADHPCAPGIQPDQVFPHQGANFHSGYIVSTSYSYGDSTPSSVALYRSGEWGSGEPAAFEGLPDLGGPITHTAWTKFVPEKPEIEDSGAPMTVPLPQGDGFFDATTSCVVRSTSHVFVGGDTYCLLDGFGDTAHLYGLTSTIFIPAIDSSPHSEKTLALDAVRVTVGSRRFKPVGVKAIPNPNPAADYVSSYRIGTVWVLCGKATD